MNEIAISVKNLSKHFGRALVVDDISFTLEGAVVFGFSKMDVSIFTPTSESPMINQEESLPCPAGDAGDASSQIWREALTRQDPLPNRIYSDVRKPHDKSGGVFTPEPMNLIRQRNESQSF